ncbi:hypothetical protein GUITHDRAFT_118025 [Guillardia theta CCMP2712]|uniref:HTH-like domain-containing protein n=1 Tax=Guillardia theta (strain CCMP2712) TaxID=905079 RepID=L1II06_GUITC|nr:hypothetical protein GUITHDRAFT_118025 [Guillardia theta CCMP2712]EKX35878.1 hypothetical protein GUITHDRAFT_118025 [Guillardia theta CCMP2712]|mmetsp:Transcript_8810/g.29415  ORF Transcript_8810/g.29415 Transcript_8810/m.29415 type:complete len:160 (-) Transcript_8810:3748-4227(-)|eukprot:XP_005822858.1 hypothetical protein GUITHDRAFT_118025 [Guillardia theta CCMP2712]
MGRGKAGRRAGKNSARLRSQASETGLQPNDETLEDEILSIKSVKPEAGVNTIWLELKRERGWDVSHHRVHERMKEMKIIQTTPRAPLPCKPVKAALALFMSKHRRLGEVSLLTDVEPCILEQILEIYTKDYMSIFKESSCTPNDDDIKCSFHSTFHFCS